MACLRGKSRVKKADARFKCRKCGALARKKAQVCKARKV